LREAVGSLAPWLQQLARGVDNRPVVANRTVKSSGSENTYAEDLTDASAIRQEVASMATRASSWLLRKRLLARTVTIKVRYDDFTTVTRSHTAVPTDREESLVARATDLLAKTDAGRRPVRLLGVSVHNLIDPDAEPPPQERLPFLEDC
jgi:DNA polymerase-4